MVPGDEILPGTIILVNGKNVIHLQGLQTALEPGKVVIFPPAGGG
ncbi:hypothetical protein HPY42_01265 [Coprothermobacteraceae bacterium]|nr:hypothetical protein [Coprothermobacteraceae bacterium]